MIGGTDVIVLFRGPGSDALTCAADALREVWPEAVIVSASPLEWFVYRDELACQSWNRNGAVPENEGGMIHLLAEPWGSMTVVLDDRRSPAAQAVLKALAGLVLRKDWTDDC
jgi:hypothetical protein